MPELRSAPPVNELIENWLKRLGPALEWLKKEGGLAGFFHEVAKTPRVAAEVSRSLGVVAAGADQPIAKQLADFLEAMKLPAKDRAKRLAEKELDDTPSLDAAAKLSKLSPEHRAKLDAWLGLAAAVEHPGPPAKRKKRPPLMLGAKVNHKKFGPGVVKAVEGEKTAIVEFADGETRRLDTSYLD